MADAEFDLSRPKACYGPAGRYVARLFHQLRNGRLLNTQVQLPNDYLAVRDPFQAIEDARLAATDKLRQKHLLGKEQEVTPESVAAIAVMRVCLNRRHDYPAPGPTVHTEDLTLERVRSFVVVRDITETYQYVTSVGHQARPNADTDWLTTAKLSIDGEYQPTLSRVIQLPLTAYESRNASRYKVFETQLARGGRADDPVVLAHVLDEGIIEVMVDPRSLIRSPEE
ncbi:hypothetical protein KDA23_04835 [Candidatus Saccharibacteria bacterium]|nr:hypothetical protein [Candidatus Saccharibacteria bacterium]